MILVLLLCFALAANQVATADNAEAAESSSGDLTLVATASQSNDSTGGQPRYQLDGLAGDGAGAASRSLHSEEEQDDLTFGALNAQHDKLAAVKHMLDASRRANNTLQPATGKF